MQKNPYKHFNEYIIRTPLLPLSFFEELTEGSTVDKQSLRRLCENDVIKEALFLASPSFYQQFERWLDGRIREGEEESRMIRSLFKYLSRMSSRCTPFGLFAGTSIGEFSDKTQLELAPTDEFRRHTRLDMNYLVALSQDLVKDENIRRQLCFFPNNSIYSSGSELRYIEYRYINGGRFHQIIGLEDSEYLQLILESAKEGVLLSHLSEKLETDEISADDAMHFLNDLVDCQFLISELEPSVSGPEFLDQLLPVLKSLEGTEKAVKTLEDAQVRINQIDQKIGNKPQAYLALAEDLKELGTSFDPKFLFQTDLTLNFRNCDLGQGVLDKIMNAFGLLNKISFMSQETKLKQFGQAVYARYEDREVQLAKALDIELGVGYIQNNDSGDISPLVSDIVVPPKPRGGTTDVPLSNIHAILQQKLMQAAREGQTVIYLRDEDFKEFGTNWNDLPDTISAMIEIVSIDGQEKIIMPSVGGSTAANLLGRFCHGDEQIDRYTKRIAEIEQQMNEEKILAEIVHLPESRAGNILLRPQFRKYEIPYLAKSLVSPDYQLSIDDLSIQASYNGTVTLRSTKTGKEVLPRLSNAHNYSNQALPVYNFLGDLQLQQKRWVGFRWDAFTSGYDFLPRVEYNGVIFCEARWNVSAEEISDLQKTRKEESRLKIAVEKWRSKRNIPRYFLLKQGDNELLINTDNLTSVQVLLDAVKNLPRFLISEFLHADSGITSCNGDTYTNEVVVSFFNQERLSTNGKDD